jgi:DNA-binding NtrC family response regulator
MPYTILFVDDDDNVRASTEAILKDAGFRMLVAKDGAEALQLLEENKVHVLFSDIVMPGISGTELARRVRQQYPDVKIMLMTGYYSRAAEAVKLGKLMFKPLRGSLMIEELTSLVLRTAPMSGAP